jgi:hypothetical protein
MTFSVTLRSIVLAAVLAVIAGWAFGQNARTANSLFVTQRADLDWHKIDLGYCGFWSRAHKQTIDFHAGFSLQTQCAGRSFFSRIFRPGFRLTVLKDGTAQFETGRCIFEGGCNFAYYLTPRSDPKQLVGTVWRNFDGGSNDPPRRIDEVEFTGPEEPYLDWVDWKFDLASRSLTWTAYKYRYLKAPSRHKYDPRCEYTLSNIGQRLDSATKSRTVFLPDKTLRRGSVN